MDFKRIAELQKVAAEAPSYLSELGSLIDSIPPSECIQIGTGSQRLFVTDDLFKEALGDALSDLRFRVSRSRTEAVETLSMLEALAEKTAQKQVKEAA